MWSYCRLSKNQEAEVRKAAAEKAVMDMNDGKIPPNKVSEQTEKYVVELTRQKKGDIVTAERINASLRGNRFRIT